MDKIAFGALVKRKRGQARLTQETLALDVFRDSTRKGDISRVENGKVEPQEATIQKLCQVLGITDAEMEPIRTFRPAEQLDQIPTLSRDQLELLASRFGAEAPHDQSDGQLREFLTKKAQEYRALRAEVDAIDAGLKRLSNLKAAAQEAIARVDLEEVEELLSRVQEVELEEAAKTAELRAENALLRGRVDQAYTLLSAAADSFAAVDPLEPVRRRVYQYSGTLRAYGERYGGDGLQRSADLLRPCLTNLSEIESPALWGAAQNNLAVALDVQGTRTGGQAGADLMAEAVTTYRAALRVRTEDAHPVQWAETMENIAIALQAIAEHDTTADPRPHLQKALTHVTAALRVYDPEHLSVRYENATRLRDQIQAALDAL